MKRNSIINIIKLFIRYIILIVIAIIMVGPFLWLLSNSFRAGGNIYSLSLIPEKITFHNFIYVWEKYSIGKSTFNSFYVAGLTILFNLILCSLAAYPLARMEFPGRNFIFFLILSTMMVPFQLIMFPLFKICVDLQLKDTFMGIILPFSVGAFGVFLIKQFYITIPKELEESARIDGAGDLMIWAKIMFPLTKPALATLAIFTFVGSWSNFLWPLIILQSEEKFTLPLIVSSLMGVFSGDWHYLAAASVISIVPVIVFFLILQRYFLEGMIVGAIKG